MKLHFNTIPAFLLECLHKLMRFDAFNDFVLVGGTAMSLQLGHRMSVDIDLFTSIEYGSMDLKHIKRTLETGFPFVDRMESFNEPSIGYTVYIGNSRAENVKLDLFYTDNFVAP